MICSNIDPPTLTVFAAWIYSSTTHFAAVCSNTQQHGSIHQQHDSQQFAATRSRSQQIAAVDLFSNIILYSSLQQIATVDPFINNVIRSSMDPSALTIFAVCSSTELIVNVILRSMIEIILGGPTYDDGCLTSIFAAVCSISQR